MSGCHYCGTPDGLRPYGPGGAPICFGCMKADPEREAAAGRNFETQLDAASAMSPSGGVIIDADGGMYPAPADNQEDGR